MLGGKADGSSVVAGIGNHVVNPRLVQLRAHQGKLCFGQFRLQIHLGHRRFFREENPAHGLHRFIAEDGETGSILECDVPQGGAAIPDLIHRKASAVQRQFRADQVVIVLKMGFRLHFRSVIRISRYIGSRSRFLFCFLALRLKFGALHILPFGSFPLGNLLFQFVQIVFRHPLGIEVGSHAVLIHIEAVMQIVPDAVALIRSNDGEAFIGRNRTLRGNLFCLRQHPVGLGKEAPVIHQNPQLTLYFRPRQFQRSMVGDNRKGIRTAELIFQPCGSSAFPPMCQHIVVDTGFAFKAAVPTDDGIADFIGCDRLRRSSRFSLQYGLFSRRRHRKNRCALRCRDGHLGGVRKPLNLFLYRIRQTVIVEFHRPVRVNMGDGLVITVFCLFPVPDRHAISQSAVSDIVAGQVNLLCKRPQGINAPLIAALRDSGYGHIKLRPKLLHIPIEGMGRYAAHFHMPHTGDVPGGQANIQQFGGLPCILAVQFKEVTHLEQHHIIRMVVLYIVIGVVDGIAPQVLLIQLLFLRGQIPVFPDQGIHTLSNLRPVQLHRGTSAFGQPDALGAVILGGMVSPRQRMRAPADAVLLFQKIRFFLHGVVCGKIGVDSALTALHRAAAGKRFADFILGNKALRLC